MQIREEKKSEREMEGGCKEEGGLQGYKSHGTGSALWIEESGKSQQGI